MNSSNVVTTTCFNPNETITNQVLIFHIVLINMLLVKFLISDNYIYFEKLYDQRTNQQR